MTDGQAVEMLVERCSIPGEFGPSGDFLRVDGIELGETRASGDLEFQRAKERHPDNPAFHMRPMFYTGSPYGAEILALHGITRKHRGTQ